MTIVEFPLEAGGSFLVEVDEQIPHGGLQRAGVAGDRLHIAQQSLQKTLEKIGPIAQSIIDELRGLAERPTEVTVEFGIKLSAEAGVILSKAAAEGNYNITLKWTGAGQK